MAKAFGIYCAQGRRSKAATTRWTTPPRSVLLDGAGDFAGTIAYGENPGTALAKLKRLAAEG